MLTRPDLDRIGCGEDNQPGESSPGGVGLAQASRYNDILVFGSRPLGVSLGYCLYAVYCMQYTSRQFQKRQLPNHALSLPHPHSTRSDSTQLRHLNNERSGKNHDKRQDLLQREGINKPKKSALLGIGGADLASVGAEDMFSKATYDPAKACAVEGLVETSVPGRYTPRKQAAAVAATATHITAPTADSAETTAHTVLPPRRTVDSRGLLATPAPATVFRVIPTGLGYKTDHRAGRGEGSVSGIAPTKRFCGSRSAPTLGLEPQAVKPRVALLPGAGRPTGQPLPLPEGGVSSGKSFSGERDRKPDTAAAAPAALESYATRASSSDTGSGRSYEEEDSENGRGRRSALSQSLSRSHSDFSRGRSGAGDIGEYGVSGTGAVETSSSRDRFSPALVDDLLGSVRSRYRQPRGASPAQRRNVDQLALDFAAVRSLEP